MSRASLLLACLALIGCGTATSRSTSSATTAGPAQASVAAQSSGGAFFVRTGADGHSLPLDAEASWPSGWMVAAHDANLPVIDSIGRALCEAREAFHEARLEDAARALESAAASLAAPADASAERVDAVSSLRALARRITTQELTTMHLFEGIITRAYAARLGAAWTPLSPTELRDVLARQAETVRALRASEGDPALMSRRLLALCRVEFAQEATPDAELDAALSALDALVRAQAPGPDAQARDAVLSRLDLAFARHDLTRAEAELRDERLGALGASLLALARHVASVDASAGIETSELAARLESAGQEALVGRPVRSTAATLAQTARHLRELAVASTPG